MFTVRRLGVTSRLANKLTNANCNESMILVARRSTGRVAKWKDGMMKKRWIAAGMLERKDTVATAELQQRPGHRPKSTIYGSSGGEEPAYAQAERLT